MLEQCTRPLREVGARQDIIREGDTPDKVFLILAGFACRYKIIEGGRRQIMAYLVPGDFCDFQAFILNEMDHNIGTLSACQVVEIPRSVILAMTDRPAIARSLWWASLVDSATLREWLVNMGQRPAEQRIAHLLCELLVRLEAVGLVTDNTYMLPITQTDLGDTMGLTVVHANRMLASLRDEALIEVDVRKITIRDVRRLKAFSGFNANYLHLDNPARMTRRSDAWIPRGDLSKARTDNADPG
ncbi:Crp/Fnr family transcriptional regulator [Fulvimarina sp. 2208YS6-2-32]|nr:Crp/Fnr family transcriptional regulator [Fulvimarina sp. 2208YS6-2-32]